MMFTEDNKTHEFFKFHQITPDAPGKLPGNSQWSLVTPWCIKDHFWGDYKILIFEAIRVPKNIALPQGVLRDRGVEFHAPLSELRSYMY